MYVYRSYHTISAGTIQLAAANILPDITALTLTGTLDLNGFSETIGSLAGAGTVTSTAAGAIDSDYRWQIIPATTTFSGLDSGWSRNFKP
jgi:fibronectin-binding autotransporter adhesin